MKFTTFFSKLQEASWYRAFLEPVINEVDSKGTLLDIGTGSGKLLQILYNEKGLACTGVDTNADMLAEARNKLKNTEVELIEIKADAKLPFKKNSFDHITICSVLFHLKDNSKDKMLSDALGLLKEGGKIIILTPTGKGNILKLSKHFFSFENRGIYTWHRATKKRARSWFKKNYLEQYTSNNKLNYKRELVMNEFALLEVIMK